MVGSLTGTVVRGASLQPESGMVLRFAAVSNSLQLSVEYKLARSDAAGWFALDGLRPGRWSVSYQDSHGAWRQFYSHVLEQATTSIDIDVCASPGVPSEGQQMQTAHSGDEPGRPGAIAGRVIDARSGLAIADAAITMIKAAGPFPDIAPLTDAAGAFSLGDLPPGEWAFRVLCPDGRVGDGSVTVRSGRTVETVIEIGGG